MNYRTAIKNRRQKQGAINSQVKDAMRGLTPRTAKLTYDLSHDLKNVFDNDRNAYVKAIQAVSNLIDSFALPSRPKYSLCGMVKSATAKDGTVTDGIIRINAILSTLMGHKASIDIPVIVREKMLIEPAVFFYDGAPYVMCKAAFDQLVKRGTLQKDLAPRSMYSAPFDGEVAEAEPPRQPIINRNHMFSPGSMNPWKFRRYSQTTPRQIDPLSPEVVQDPKELSPDTTVEQMLGTLSKMKLAPDRQKVVNDLKRTYLKDKDNPDTESFVRGWLEKEIIDSQEYMDIGKSVSEGVGITPRDTGRGIEYRTIDAAKEKVQRERTNIDTPTEMPELWGEYTEDQMLDPAERCRHDMVQVGSEVSLKKDFEVRERGGSQIVIPSGEEGKVIKDMKGDGMCMVVHFPVMHLDAVVPVKFLKGASFNQKADSQVEVPKASGGTEVITVDELRARIDKYRNAIEYRTNALENHSYMIPPSSRKPEYENIQKLKSHLYELENILKGVSSSPFDRSAAVKDVWQTTKEKMPEHAKTLMGERPAGSQWGGEGFGEQHLDLPWEDVTEKVPEGAKMPGAKYWHLPPEHRKQHFPQANVGAVPMTELPANLLSKVQMAQGAHGKELQIREEDLPPELLEQAGEFGAHLITGPEEGVGDVVYTAFPGPIMAPLPRNFEGDVSELMKHEKPYAVKVVKGTKTASKIEDLKQQLHDLYREQDELKGDVGLDKRQRYLGITKRIDALKAEIAKQESTKHQAATVDQVKHEIREMLREGYQDIDIQAAITQKYPDVAEEALSGLK